MARLTRKLLKLFGDLGGSSSFGQFGSQAVSAPIETKDIDTIQALAAWSDGWQDAVALGQAPYLQDMNGQMYVHSYELSYLYQDGIPEYLSTQTYYKGAVVKNLANTGYVEFYASLIDTNVGNALPTRTSDGNWAFLYAMPTTPLGLIIPGTKTNDSAAAGNIGEAVRSAVQAVPSAASATFGNITSISLTAGDWDVSANGFLAGNSSMTPLVAWHLAISLFSGNITTDQVAGDNDMETDVEQALTQFTSQAITAYRISLASPATVYLKGQCQYTGATPLFYGRISARRVR